MTITDSDLKTIIDSFVDIANSDGELQSVMDTYQSDRSLGVKIMGSKLNTGFMISDRRLKLMTELHQPTVLVTMGRATFWDVINSENGNLARMKVYRGIFTDQDILVDPPPGLESGMLHIENVIKVFARVAQVVMG